MKILARNLKNKFYEYVKTLSNKGSLLQIALPELKVSPVELKSDYIYDVNEDLIFFDLITDKYKTLSSDAFINYIMRIQIQQKESTDNTYHIDKHHYIEWLGQCYELIKQRLNSIEHELLIDSDKIQHLLISYNLMEAVKRQLNKNNGEFPELDGYDINLSSKTNLTIVYGQFRDKLQLYESIVSKAENLLKELKRDVFERTDEHLNLNKSGTHLTEKSIVRLYLKHLKGRDIFLSGIYKKPHIKSASDIARKHSKVVLNKSHKKVYRIGSLFHSIVSLVSNFATWLKLSVMGVIIDTLIFFSTPKAVSIDDALKIAEMNNEWTKLKLNTLEIKRSPFTITDYSHKSKDFREYNKALATHSLALQDEILLRYANKPPLSINLNKGKRFSLLNAVSLLFLFLCISILVALGVANLTHQGVKLHPITETARIINTTPDIYGKDSGDVNAIDELMLTSFSQSGELDEEFISEMKLNTSIGLLKEKEIRENIMQKIMENEEEKQVITFDKTFESIKEEVEEETTYNPNQTGSNNNEDNNTSESKNEALNIDEPLSLPDYSEYMMKIEPNELDLSIKNKRYSIDDFNKPIIRLQKRFDDWYEQTEIFFSNYARKFDITKEHQTRFLSFIKDLDPVKIFEAYNFQYQNYPYLLDRIIKDDMPVIYTASSTDAKEFGLWSKQGIGIFYDLSSYDVFKQTLLHEMTHDLVERVYGTPIILEGITEMLAMNLMAYLNGEGFSHYKGPVRVAQYLYNRNPKAVIDYYIGIRKDEKGRDIDIFNKNYVTRNFLNDGVNDDIARKNTELIHSMLDIPFHKLLRLNRTIVPLQGIINTHKKHTPLVMQADFNYAGLNNDSITPTDAIDNLDELLLPRLREYIDGEKKIAFYTLLAIGSTIQLLENNDELDKNDKDRLKLIRTKFKEMQREITEKNLLYEENELSERSKELLKKGYESTYSDKEHQQKLNEYEEKSDTEESPLSENYSDKLSDDEKELMQEEMKKQFQEHLDNSSQSNSTDEGTSSEGEGESEGDISEEQLKEFVEKELQKDISSYISLINSYNPSIEDINDKYDELLKKYGSNIKITLDDLTQQYVTNRLEQYDAEKLSQLPISLEALKKRFTLMEEAIKENDTQSEYYTDLNDPSWLKYLSKIAQEEYSIRYYQLLIDSLKDYGDEVDVEKTLKSLKKIVSYVNTAELLTRYKDDLKAVIDACPSNSGGIQRLSQFNKHLKGLVHPYVKNEVLSHLSDLIIRYIEGYPSEYFNEVLSSFIVDNLSNTELLSILEKALRLNTSVAVLLEYLNRYSKEYSKINITPLADDFITLYNKEISQLVRDSYHSRYVDIIYRSEKILLEVFGKDESSYDNSKTMKGFYIHTSELLKARLRSISSVNEMLGEIETLSEREKHVILFNLSTQLNDIGWISLDNFNRIYNKVFIRELNLYDSYSGKFIELMIRIGQEKIYSKNLYSLIENSPNKAYYYYDNVWEPSRSLLDYLSTVNNDDLKRKLSTYIIDFLTEFADYNYIENSNIFFILDSTLDKHITHTSYEKLIELRYSIKSNSFLNIPMVTEVTYFILKMMVTHPHLITDGLPESIRNIIASICEIADSNDYDDYSLLKNLYITEEEDAGITFEESYTTMGSALYYYQVKTLHYKSNIAGMMCYVYDKGYSDSYGTVFLSQLLGFYGFYLSAYNDDLRLYNKYSFETGDLLGKRYSNDEHRPANVIYSNPAFSKEIEDIIIKSIETEQEKSFELFFLIAYEKWFWQYLTKTSNDKDELIMLLTEQPEDYGQTFSDGFLKRFFKKLLFTAGSDKYKVIKRKLLKKRDYLIPFLFSKSDELKSLISDAIEENNNEAVTFLYRMMMGNYLTTDNIHIDFFVEGELVRTMLRDFLLEDKSHFEKLYYSLPDDIIEQFDYEEELRRNLINIYYHIFQTLPPQEKYLDDLLSIYKTTLKKLLDKSTDKGLSNKDRVEEEFSKIANLMYLINDEESKKQTAETMYPLLEQFVERMKDSNEYLFANYVRENVEGKSLHLKWNLLDSIKSYAFNYKAEAGRVYEKLFKDISLDILLPYRNYLTKLIEDNYNVPPTEYRVLLETIEKQKAQEKNYGLDIMKKAYETKFDSAKNKKLTFDDSTKMNIANLISYLKNLISYSSKEKALSEVKENIVAYSKEISAVFRDLMEKKTSEKNIRLLVSEMTKEIIKLPITDKIGLFVIFSNLLIDYDAVSVTEYKYYTTLIEYLMPDLFENAEPEHYPILTKFIDDISLIIIYLQESLKATQNYYDPEQSGLEERYYSLMVMYSHYINLINISDSGNKINEYILGLYPTLDRLDLTKEEEAIIASNLLRTQNHHTRLYVNEYFKTPIFRRYLEEISDLDRNIIFTGTQKFIDWLSTIKVDYDNPLSNKYLIDIIGIDNYINNLKQEGKSNAELTVELLRWRNRFTSRISVFFTETYGYPFKDPTRSQNNPF